MLKLGELYILHGKFKVISGAAERGKPFRELSIEEKQMLRAALRDLFYGTETEAMPPVWGRNDAFEDA